jgi:hypothetical protein
MFAMVLMNLRISSFSSKPPWSQPIASFMDGSRLSGDVDINISAVFVSRKIPEQKRPVIRHLQACPQRLRASAQ